MWKNRQTSTLIKALSISASIFILLGILHSSVSANRVLPTSSSTLTRQTFSPLTHTQTQAMTDSSIMAMPTGIGEGNASGIGFANCRYGNTGMAELGFEDIAHTGIPFVDNQPYLYMTCDATWSTCTGNIAWANHWLRQPAPLYYSCRTVPATVNWQ